MAAHRHATQALEQFITTELTDLVIETDAERRGSREGAPREKHVAELRNASLITARGPGLASAWRDLVDSLDRWTDVRTTSRKLSRPRKPSSDGARKHCPISSPRSGSASTCSPT